MCKSWTPPSIQSYHSLQVSNTIALTEGGCPCETSIVYGLTFQWFLEPSSLTLLLPHTGKICEFRLNENLNFILTSEKQTF